MLSPIMVYGLACWTIGQCIQKIGFLRDDNAMMKNVMLTEKMLDIN